MYMCIYIFIYKSKQICNIHIAIHYSVGMWGCTYTTALTHAHTHTLCNKQLITDLSRENRTTCTLSLSLIIIIK